MPEYETHVCLPEEANYALTITNCDSRQLIGTLYFLVSPYEGVGKMFIILGEYYPEYCCPNYRIDMSKVRNGKRMGRI